MRRLIGLCATAVLTILPPAPVDAREPELTGELTRIQDSTAVLRELTSAPDSGIPGYLLDRAAAVIVFPNLVKGGFVVGAEHGRGIISVRQATGSWSNPAFVTMTGGSIGWQIGVESVDLVLLVMNRAGVDDLLKSKFTLGGAASVTAGPIGRSARAQTDGTISSQILAYSRSRGLFAGATFNGATLQSDKDANALFYGASATLSSIVEGQGTVAPAASSAVTNWTSMLRRLSSGTAARVE